VSQGCPQQSELRQMASKTRVRNSSRTEAPAFCEKDQSQKQANDLILGQGCDAPLVSILMDESQETLGVEWSHPMGNLAGYEVQYGADGHLDKQISFRLKARPGSKGSSWIAYLHDMHGIMQRGGATYISARARVRFQSRQLSEWSATASWPEQAPSIPSLLVDTLVGGLSWFTSASEASTHKEDTPPAPLRVRSHPATKKSLCSAKPTRSSSRAPRHPRPQVVAARNATHPPCAVAIKPSLVEPKTLRYMLPDGSAYTPAENSVLVIAPGAPWVWEGPPKEGEPVSSTVWCVQALQELGYDVTVVGKATYDMYPKGWRKGCIDLSSNGGRNHTTLADDHVLPKIRELVAAGRGPALILAGSRGGQCTLPRLWDLGWRGAAVCVNAGCNTLGKVPRNCQLTLVTGGFDFFKQSATPSLLKTSLQRKDIDFPIFLYHDPKMGHTGAPDDFQEHGHHLLPVNVLDQIIKLTVSGPSGLTANSKDITLAGPWPVGAYLEVI